MVLFFSFASGGKYLFHFYDSYKVSKFTIQFIELMTLRDLGGKGLTQEDSVAPILHFIKQNQSSRPTFLNFCKLIHESLEYSGNNDFAALNLWAML